MPPGRRRHLLTLEERKAIRRQKVKSYVQAFRQRKRDLETSQGQDSGNEGPGDGSHDYSGSLLAESYESGWETEVSKDIFFIPRPTANKDPKFPINLPFKIDLGPKCANTFIAAFPGSTSSISGKASVDKPRLIRVAIYLGFWTTKFSYDVDSDEGAILNDAIIGMALNLISLEKEDQKLAVRALDLQTKSLRRLRDGFDAYVKARYSSNCFLLLATAMIFSTSELLVTKSWPNFSQHISGIGALIEHCGLDWLGSALGQNTLFGYRSHQLVFSLINRRVSFLSQPEWCDFPGRNEHELGNHPFQKLFDIIYKIPSHMEAFDNMEEKSFEWLKCQMRDMLEIESQLDRWESELPATASHSHFATVPAILEGLHSKSIDFCNPVTAVCFTLFAGVKVTVLNMMLRILEAAERYNQGVPSSLREKPNELLRWSRVVCQCLEYFFARDQRVVGTSYAAYSFITAWEALARLSRSHGMNLDGDLEWCNRVSEKLEDFEFTMLGKRMQVIQELLGVDHVSGRA